MMSAGVFIPSSRGRAASRLTAVSSRVNPALRRMEVVKERRTPAASCAPKRWAVMTASPPARPWANPSTKNMMEPVAPTAASAFTPRVRPTMMVSAML